VVFASKLMHAINLAVKVRKAIMQDVISCDLELLVVDARVHFLEKDMVHEHAPMARNRVRGGDVSETSLVIGPSRFGLHIRSDASKLLIRPGVILTSDLAEF